MSPGYLHQPTETKDISTVENVAYGMEVMVDTEMRCLDQSCVSNIQVKQVLSRWHMKQRVRGSQQC